MNILFYLFGKLTAFISLHQKKLSIFIPFLLGIVFALFYILHIHNYKFVFPKSALLYVLSCISFLTSILIVLKYVDSKVFKKIIMGILLVCLMIFVGYLLSELKILEHKILRFRLIKILTLILLIVNIVVVLFENKVISYSYKYAVENKIEVLIYFVCLFPFIVYASILYPGGGGLWDTRDMFLQAIGIKQINNWQPVIITFMFRLSLALHLSALSLLYIINILGVIWSSFTISRTTTKVIPKYLLFILTYIFPIIMHNFYLIPKDMTATIFIMLAVSMLIYSVLKKIDYHFYLGIFFLIVASLDRHNQITQTFILIIPFAILYTHHKNISVKHSFKIIALFLIIIFGLQTTLFNNKKIVKTTHSERWIQNSDILYIMLDKKSSCKEVQENFPNLNCSKSYNKMVNQLKETTSSIQRASIIFKTIYSVSYGKYNPLSWFKYIMNYPGSWLTFHYRVTLQNFLKNYTYVNFLSYYSNAYAILTKNKYNYSLGVMNLKKDGIIDKFISQFYIPFTFKYKLSLMIFILIISFITNKLKFIPTMTNNDLKYTCISYYLSLSCITLFIPLVLLVPTGFEARYLASVDFPLMVSIVMLLVYLYKKYIFLNSRLR